MGELSNPFLFGEVVENQAFFDRKEERAILRNAFVSGQNTILMAPRRYGKSSLIQSVLKELDPKEFVVINIDLYRTNTLAKFNDVISQSIAAATATPLGQLAAFLKEWAPRLAPRVIFKGDATPEVDFEFPQPPPKGKAILGDLLEITQKFAEKKGRKGVVVFDEFQEILNFGDISLLKEIRAIIQRHQKIAYCFAGSKRHLLSEIFIDASSPFYQFGKVMTIERLPRNEFFTFITDNLAATEIRDLPELIHRILDFTGCHPYYTQMFCSYIWDMSMRGEDATFEETINAVLKNQSYAYTTLWDRLTARQKNLMIALVKDNSASLHTAHAILKWDLGSSATVTKSLKSLEKDGYVETAMEQGPAITDPFFVEWIKKF